MLESGGERREIKVAGPLTVGRSQTAGVYLDDKTLSREHSQFYVDHGRVCVRDLDCAFKLFRREVVERLQLTATGACINAEMLAQCVHAGLTFHEVPVTHYPRYHGAPTGAGETGVHDDGH